MGVLKPETNRPIELSFKFITGKDCDSEYSGPQKLFTVTLATGETAPLYLSEGAGRRIEELLASQQIRPGEFVDFCKAEVRNGNRKSIEYQIKRVNPPEPPVISNPQPQNGNGANGYQPPAPPVTSGQNEQPNGNGNAPAPVNGDRPKTKIEDALKTVAAALLAAEQYAKQIGYEAWPKQFSGDEVVRLAATLLINGARENGGAR